MKWAHFQYLSWRSKWAICYITGRGENKTQLKLERIDSNLNAITYCLLPLSPALRFFQCITEYFYAFQSLMLKPNHPFSSMRRRDIEYSTTHETAISTPLPEAQGPWGSGDRENKSHRLGKSRVKGCLLDISRPLESWASMVSCISLVQNPVS